eukprot:gnl/Dysnectes_brevis/4658_a6361_860.p1 GENE.gnl/Dysnectes_brevis/4658_a6361_860~~gnl/Dysnectes_brevis/4658_a6361_860.p1  ORF type:complete len:344 (+),score=65.07 gnl/Dysnectes_brevis/4658_a6361_860:47-1078(+)
MSTEESKKSLPWVEKYRPDSLDKVISHEDIIGTLKKLIDARKLPHLLFYGPAGTGKTSTIVALANEVFGSRFSTQVLELNASDERGIDVVRERVKTFASSSNVGGTKASAGFKLVILDEADNMTSIAQFALRRIIEKYTRTTRFCLICNYVGKIIPALQSRCTRFRFKPLASPAVTSLLKEVAAKEEVTLGAGSVEALLDLAKGDMRQILNTLQAAALAGEKHVDGPSIYAVAGRADPSVALRLMESLLTLPFSQAVDAVRSQMEEGVALEDIVTLMFKLVVRTALPARLKGQTVIMLAEIEDNLMTGCDAGMQAPALASLFFQLRPQLAGILGAGSRDTAME